MDKINKIALSYVCCSLLCSTVFSSTSSFGAGPQPTPKHIFRIDRPIHVTNAFTKLFGPNQPKPPPKLTPIPRSVSKNPSSPDIPSKPADLSMIVPIRLRTKTKIALWENLGWGKSVILSTRNFNADGASVYPISLEKVEQLFAGSPPSLEHFFNAIDGSYAIYLREILYNPLTNFNQGMGLVIQRRLPGYGAQPSESQFSLEDISTVLAANDLSEIPDDVPAEHQATAKFYIFLKHCLSRFNFAQITVNRDGAGTPFRDREGRIQWALNLYVDLQQPIGVCYDGTPAECVRISFGPNYSKWDMILLTVQLITQSQHTKACQEGPVQWLVPGKRNEKDNTPEEQREE